MEGKTDLDVLLRKPTPQDIIVAIFAYSGLKTFTNNPVKIHGFIFSMKFNIKEAFALLEPFVFSDIVDVYYPYSQLLESVLCGLLLGGVIFTWSPRDDGYNMEEKMRQKVIAQTEERFSSEEITILKRLGMRWNGFNRPFSPIDVIMALLVFLPKRFPNNTEVMHRTIHRLKEIEKYKDLLNDFDDFIDYPRFPFSSRLERTLNILKGAGGGIELLSPGLDVCIVDNNEFRRRARREVLNIKFNDEQRNRLKEIALELGKALRHN